MTPLRSTSGPLSKGKPLSIRPTLSPQKIYDRPLPTLPNSVPVPDPEQSSNPPKRRRKSVLFQRGFRFNVSRKRRHCILTIDPKNMSSTPPSDGRSGDVWQQSPPPTPPTSPLHPDFFPETTESERTTSWILRRSSFLGQYCARAFGLTMSHSSPLPPRSSSVTRQKCTRALPSPVSPITGTRGEEQRPALALPETTAHGEGTEKGSMQFGFPFGRDASPSSGRGRDLGSVPSDIPITGSRTSSSTTSSSLTPSSPFEMHPGTLVNWYTDDEEARQESAEEEDEEDEDDVDDVMDEYHAYLSSIGSQRKNSLSYKVFHESDERVVGRRKSVPEGSGTRKRSVVHTRWSNLVEQFPLSPSLDTSRTSW